MTPFKKLFSSILLVLTSFVSFAQDEIVSYSYSGATDLGSRYGTNIFEYPSCKGFSLNIVFADDGDYQAVLYGEITYSYDSTLRIMNITAEPHSSSDCDTNYCDIDIYNSESFIASFSGSEKATAKADSLWFFDNGNTYTGDTIRSCDFFGNGFQFGTKINDDNYSESLYDNFFVQELFYDCWHNEIEILVNGVDRYDELRYKSYFSELGLHTGDTLEVRTTDSFRGRDFVSDNWCDIDLPVGSTTGEKILKIVPSIKADLIDTLTSYALCEGEKLKFFPNSPNIADKYGWEFREGSQKSAVFDHDDTLIVSQPSTWEYNTIISSPSSQFCSNDEVSVVQANECKGKIIGTVYDNHDGKWWRNDKLEGVLVQTNTGEVGISDSLGNYAIFFDKSNSPTHVFVADPNYMLDSNSLSFVSDTFLLAEYESLKTFRLVENDLKITMLSGRNRPGFTIPQYITIHNISKTDITTDVLVDIDPQLTYVETTNGGNPTSVSGNTITWENITVPSGEIRRYTYTAKLNRLTSLGSELNNTAFLLNNSPDNNLLNDTVHYTPVVTGSYDPNDKNAVYFGPSNGNYIHDSTNFEYKIRFQNTGTDTAFTVVVKDKITSKLDLTTFQMVDASHDYSVSIVEDTLVWTFNNILLVDSNTNEPGSHGFIRFHIDQADGNVNFDEIKNKAFIFFDYNDPIITNEFTSIVHDDLTVNAIEINHNIKVYPNPTSGMLNIEGINSGTLSISNVIGERVLFQDASGDDFGNINLENLPTGLYMLTISSENKISTIKVVKK